jgi:hypothetical protein
MLLPGGADGDFNVLTERCEEFHKAPHGEVTGTVSHQQGDLRLLHTENLGDFGLCHAAFPEDQVDLESELRFKQFLFGILKAQVRKDVSAALGHADVRSPGFCFHASWAIPSATSQIT